MALPKIFESKILQIKYNQIKILGNGPSLKLLDLFKITNDLIIGCNWLFQHKDFDIIDVGDGRREYAPIRITQDETVDRFNDEAMELNKDQIKQIVDSCKKRLGKPRAYTGTFVPPQQEQQTCDMSMSQPPKQDAFQLSDGSKREPIGTTPMMTGAPKPTFTLNKPKPKQNKGFKNLLKSDKPTIDIETK